MHVHTDKEKRQAQLKLYEPDVIETRLREVGGGGSEYAAAAGMITGTRYTLGSSDAERLAHIDRILDALHRVTERPQPDHDDLAPFDDA